MLATLNRLILHSCVDLKNAHVRQWPVYDGHPQEQPPVCSPQFTVRRSVRRLPVMPYIPSAVVRPLLVGRIRFGAGGLLWG